MSELQLDGRSLGRGMPRKDPAAGAARAECALLVGVGCQSNVIEPVSPAAPSRCRTLLAKMRVKNNTLQINCYFH